VNGEANSDFLPKMGSEKFCLRWNDFENNISSAFRELRDDKDFFDVTLACDDEQIQAHKVILSACSPFFRNVLRRNPHQNPLLYLKGVKYTDLQSVLNFMYHGEVNVAQEELNSFLAVAEDLRVKGLTQNQSGSQPNSQKENSLQRTKSPPLIKPITPRQQETVAPPDPALKQRPRPSPPVHHPVPAPITEDFEIQEVVPIKAEPRELAYNIQEQTQSTVEDQSLATYQEEDVGYEDYSMEQYDDHQYDAHPIDPSMQGVDHGNKGNDRNQLVEYIAKVQDEAGSKYSCTLCNMTNNLRTNVMNHVESAHFPNSFLYNCDYCVKTFKSLNSKNVHVSRNHKNIHVKKYMYK